MNTKRTPARRAAPKSSAPLRPLDTNRSKHHGQPDRSGQQLQPHDPSPMEIVGKILALGAIRLIDRQERESRLANRAQESVHRADPTTQDNTHD